MNVMHKIGCCLLLVINLLLCYTSHSIDVCDSFTSSNYADRSTQCSPAINFLEPWKPVCHHSIFQKIANLGKHQEITRHTIVEETGLRVPFQYDCEPWSSHPYHVSVPSRFVRCAQQKALWSVGQRHVVNELPVIDEEYFEYIAVYQSALMAKNTFVMTEMGSRWGTWGARAVKMLELFNPMPAHLLYYEPEGSSAEGLRVVHAMNAIANYTLKEAYADADSFAEWSSGYDHIDLVDIDIQSAESEMLPKIMDVLKKKVYRVIIGTHSSAIHAATVSLLESNNFIVHIKTPFQEDTQCIQKNMRGHRNLTKLMEEGCFHDTSFGAVCNWDGEVIADNSVFLSRGERNACLL